MTIASLRFDRSVRRLDGGRVLVGGSPLRLFRLSERGAAVLDTMAAGAPTPADAGRLIERLVDAGALHPVPRDGPWRPSDVTVVIPALDADVSALVERVGPVHEIIVVDDASSPPLRAPRPLGLGPHHHRPPVRIVRRRVNGGPGAARATGLDEVTTPLVAFLDTDCRPDPGWLDPLLAHLGDGGDRGDRGVVLVAPRIVSLAGLGLLARYESMRSPLDLGAEPARIRARTRVAYVPAAALVARTADLRAVGGFDAALRTGEDVDLVWRLDEAGARLRYEPASVVRHLPRPTLAQWLAQRSSYGASAAPLARRHPGAAVPVAVSAWSAAAWALVAAGRPRWGMAVGAGSALALARRLSFLDHPVAEALRLAGWGHLHAGRQLASAITRTWWPIALVAVTGSRRARRAVAAAALGPALVDWWREAEDGDDVGPLAYLALRLLDDVAYGTGVWRGVLAARTVAPLVPDLTSWPRASSYERARGGP